MRREVQCSNHTCHHIRHHDSWWGLLLQVGLAAVNQHHPGAWHQLLLLLLQGWEALLDQHMCTDLHRSSCQLLLLHAWGAGSCRAVAADGSNMHLMLLLKHQLLVLLLGGCVLDQLLLLLQVNPSA